MKVTDNRKVTIEIGGCKHKVSFDEAQELYRELGRIAGMAGIARITYGGGIISGSSSYIVGERGPELVSGSTLARLAGNTANDEPDEDDPPMAVAV